MKTENDVDDDVTEPCQYYKHVKTLAVGGR